MPGFSNKDSAGPGVDLLIQGMRCWLGCSLEQFLAPDTSHETKQQAYSRTSTLEKLMLFCQHNSRNMSEEKKDVNTVNRCFIGRLCHQKGFRKTSKSPHAAWGKTEVWTRHPRASIIPKKIQKSSTEASFSLKQATDVTTTTGSLVHVLDVRMQIRQLLPSAVRIPMSRGVHVRQLFLDGLRVFFSGRLPSGND